MKQDLQALGLACVAALLELGYWAWEATSLRSTAFITVLFGWPLACLFSRVAFRRRRSKR